MLISLHIENIAVIKSVDIDFSAGFSAFTGETGAGKSIIIDSIGLLLGKRADRELIRHGEARALVSAVFDVLSPETVSALAAIGVEPDEEGKILLQRLVQADGHSTIRLNGRVITLSLLKEIGPALIHIHGQNDNRMLTDPHNQMRILDRYAATGAALLAYRTCYQKLSAVRRQLHAVVTDEGERLREIEMLQFQIADIDALSLKEGEEEKLEEKRKRLQHAEKIEKSTAFTYRALKGSEKGSAIYLISRSMQALSQIVDALPEVAAQRSKLEELLWQIDDVAEQISEYGGEGEAQDPTEQLNRVEERLYAINCLCRKYGKDVAAVLAFRARAAERLAALAGADERRAALEKEENLCVQQALAAARILQAQRQVAAERLCQEITSTLSFLDMPRVHFAIQLTERHVHGAPAFDENGIADIEFLIATNPGEAPAPMAKIASGGELARIMLALKSVIADRDGIQTVIYDEVDTGVSGKTARKIGMKLKETGQKTQVLCVTHSAQIASLSVQHFVITKQERNGRAETCVTLLSDTERVEELARILGGLSVTEAQRQAARDMVEDR